MWNSAPTACDCVSGRTEAFSLLGKRALDIQRGHALRGELESAVLQRFRWKLTRARLRDPSQHPLRDIGRQYLAETGRRVHRPLSNRDGRTERSAEQY
jgi:hypothetical protein